MFNSNSTFFNTLSSDFIFDLIQSNSLVGKHSRKINIDAGDSVSEGDVIATIYTRQGRVELKSPYTGVLLLKNPSHAPHERQELAKFLVE